MKQNNMQKGTIYKILLINIKNSWIVLVCSGCYKRISQTWKLKTTEMYFS